MNGSCETPQEKLCGCCQGVGAETPELIFNRPGLRQISYRVGTQPAFKASLIAGLSSSELPALAPLRTRDDSDFSIALLDAWAVSLDILSFYDERLANEAYLGTAVDAASVMYLAQLVGYKPSPGVAASAFLAFTLTDAPGAPASALIPAPTRVQSVPNPGEKPQVFETSSDLTALIEQNAIPPQTTVPWSLNPFDTSIWLEGTSSNIRVGDAILFVSQQLHDAVAQGSTSASGAADFHFVTAVTIDSKSGNTLIQWDQPLTQNWPPNDQSAFLYVLRKKAALFGSQAPDPRTLTSTSQNNLANLAGWPPGGNGDWLFQEGYPPNSSQVNLDTTYPGLVPPASGEPEWAVFTAPDLTLLYQVTAAADVSPALFTLTNRATQLTLANQQQLFNNIQPAPNLGALEFELAIATELVFFDFISASDPTQDILFLQQALAAFRQAQAAVAADQVLAHLIGETRSASAYVQNGRFTPADSPLSDWIYDDTFARQSGMLRPVEGPELAIIGTQQLSAGQPVAVSGQRLRLQVVNLAVQPPGTQPGFTPEGAVGSKPLADGQILLIDAFPPQVTSNFVDLLWSVLTTEGVAGTLRISVANLLLIPADKNDPVVGEARTISQTSPAGSVNTLSFTQPLSRIYDRGSVTVNANVVLATNGETMHEILGNGDATNAALQFALKQSPLTYISSSLGQGAASTLKVWVNNLEWHEVDNFLPSGPNDRVFATQADSTGKVTVLFGDGVEGARTPTGQMNIRAQYRKGIGAAGNVQAGQLSQALDRPQGLKGAINPEEATGGADPDSADSARVSAPLHVLTLERVVSLEDYQNYALAFAGIAKALATWTWIGRTRSVFLTVAGAKGTVFQADDPTVTNLLKALRGAGNPYIPLTVDSYTPALFTVGANIRVDSNNYDPTLVLAQVWQTLAMNLNFDQRQIGQGVAQSEVIALIQATPGVIAVELTAFNRQGQSSAPGTPLPAVLRAAAPLAGQQGTPQPAEMLILDPASQGNLAVWS